MRYLKTLLLMCTVGSSVACGGTIAVSYSPGITKRGAGPIRVDPFQYEPHRTAANKFAPNQIQNTAVGNIYMTQNVSEFIRDAVKMELHFMGYEYANSSYRAIRGNVLEFLADDLGFSVDWSLRAQFEVVTAQGKVFSGTCHSTTKTEKDPGFVQGATTEIVRKCIDQFVVAAQAQKAL